MTAFGRHTAGTPLREGAVASVFSVPGPDGKPSGAVIKHFHPPASPLLRRFLAVEGFLVAAERQQRAAKAGGPAVEVHEFGRTPEGAYVVLARQEPSWEALGPLLHVTSPLLRALAAGTLEALANWEVHFGAPHGNLRAGNIFLPGRGPLAERRVLLSDPAFEPGAKAKDLRRRELAQLGGLIVQLVRRREAAGWPIEDAPEWKRLGRNGTAWREFCNALLDPHAAEPAALDDLRGRLKRLRSDRSPAFALGVGAGVFVLLAAAGVGGYARFGDPREMPERLQRLAELVGNARARAAEPSASWANLARAWDGWLAGLSQRAEALAARDALWDTDDPVRERLRAVAAARDALWDTDDPVRERLRAVAAARERLDPGVLVSARGRSGASLIESPPDEAFTVRVDQQATAVWSDVEALAQALEAWPRWEALRSAAAEMRARGLEAAAEDLERNLPAGTATGDYADALWNLSGATTELAFVGTWSAFQAAASELAASGDAVQAGIPRHVLDRLPAADDLRETARAVAEATTTLRQFRARFQDPAVARERFLKESFVATFSGPVDEDVLARWASELAAFSRIPAADDPRVAAGWTRRLADLREQARPLEDAPPPEDAAAGVSFEQFESEAALLERNAGELVAREFLRRDLAELGREVAGLTGRFAQLETRVQTALDALRPERWIEGVLARRWDTGGIQTAWEAWRTAALATATPAALSANAARFRALRAEERAVRVWFESLQGTAGLGGLPAVDLGPVGDDVRGAVAALAGARRDALVAGLVRALDIRPGNPPGAFDGASPPVARALDAERRWLAGTPAWARTLDGLGRLLREGYGWDEGVDAALAALQREEGLAGLAGAPARWIEDARALESVARSSDRAVLTAAAAGEGLSLRLTAWRRLGALDGWPGDAAELDADGALVEALRRAAGEVIPAGERRTALVEELARETRRRWNRAAGLAAAAGGEAIAEVFARMERFGIGETDLEAPVAYNLRLWRLRQEALEDLDLDALRQRRDAFVAAARAQPDVVREGPVASFLDRIAGLGLTDENRASVISPFRAGWREEYPSNGERAVARWSGGGRTFELGFVRVVPTDGTPPFYLAERAVSVGEFADLVSRRPEGGEVLAAMQRFVREGEGAAPWAQIFAWRAEPGGRALRVADSWVFKPTAPVLGVLRPGPDGRAPLLVGPAAAEAPSGRMPMQQIPPEAARLFAERVLGARLPRPEEWRAVARLAGTRVEGNLRDEAFAAQWQQAVSLGLEWRPDEGRFRPGARTDGGDVWPGVNDGAVWFTPVDEGPRVAGFVNLFGNVAVFLFDPQARQYFAAGGSALSPPDIDPREPVLVQARRLIGAGSGTPAEGYADVGIRPAFDLQPGLQAKFEFVQLVRQQTYLRR